MTATTAEKRKSKKPADALLAVEYPEDAATDAEHVGTDETEVVKDHEVILPPPGELTIQGVKCTVRRLRMREFFGLMGIMTAGLGPAMGNMGFAEAEDADEFGALLMAGFIMAVPNQIPQFIKWTQDIVEPQGSKQENREVRDYLDNPEIEDILPILDTILVNEKDNLYELVGKARAYMPRWAQMFQR